LLNPKHCTDKVDTGASMGNMESAMPEHELRDLLYGAVPNLDEILFYGSSGGKPGMIAGFVLSTYRDGFPAYKNNAELTETYIKMMRFIMRKVKLMSLAEQKAILGRLCKAFQDCQAVQSRMVQATYDQLLGRNLQRQVLALVDRLKVDETGVLRRVTYELRGSEHGAALPHVEAGIVAAIGFELGLPGTTSSINDPHKQGCSDVAKHVSAFRRLFQVDELTDWLATDINNWGEDHSANLELYIETGKSPNADGTPNPDAPPGALVKFLTDLVLQQNHKAKLFADSCYFDEDSPEKYKGTPNEAQEWQDQPFIHSDIALQMLEYIFVPQPLIHQDGFQLKSAVAAPAEQ